MYRSGADTEIDYEFSERDYHVMMSGFASTRAKQSRGLMTRQLREAEEQQRIASYGPIPIRIEFPDGYIIQASFPVTTPLRQLHELVYKVLHPSYRLQFHLFTTPPKKAFKPKDLDELTLYSAQLIPAARIHVGVETMPEQVAVLDEPIAASRTSEPPSKSYRKPAAAKQQQQEAKADDSSVQKAVGSGANGQKKAGGGVPKWMRLSSK